MRLLVKYYFIWFIINFILSLLPVLITLGIDCLMNSGDFNYSDTAFLGIISFSFTILITSHYSRMAWEKNKPLINVLTGLFLFGLFGFYTYYYTVLSTEGRTALILADKKLFVGNSVFVVSFILSLFLNGPTIEKYQINETQKGIDKEMDGYSASQKKTKKDFDGYSEELRW